MSICPACDELVDDPIGFRREHFDCAVERITELFGDAYEYAQGVERVWQQTSNWSLPAVAESVRRYDLVIEECRAADIGLLVSVRLLCQVFSAGMLLVQTDLREGIERLDATRAELETPSRDTPAPTTESGAKIREELARGYRNLARILSGLRADASGPVTTQNASAFEYLARWAIRGGDYDAAEWYWTQLNNSSAPIWVINSANSLCFSVLMPQGRFDEAQQLLNQGVLLNLGYQSVNCRSNLGVCEFEQGHSDAAVVHFLEVLRAPDGPFDEALHYLARIAEARGDESEATRLRDLLQRALPTSAYAARHRGEETSGGLCPAPAFPLLPEVQRGATVATAVVYEEEPDDEGDDDYFPDGYEYASAVSLFAIGEIVQQPAEGGVQWVWVSNPAAEAARQPSDEQVQQVVSALQGSVVEVLRERVMSPLDQASATAPVDEDAMLRSGWTVARTRGPMSQLVSSVRLGVVNVGGKPFLQVDAPIFVRRPEVVSGLLEEMGARADAPWQREWCDLRQLQLTVEWMLRKVETSHPALLGDLEFLVNPQSPPSATANTGAFPGWSSRRIAGLMPVYEEGVARFDLKGIVWAGWQFELVESRLRSTTEMFLGRALLALIDLPNLMDVDDAGMPLYFELMGVPFDTAESWYSVVSDRVDGGGAVTDAENVSTATQAPANWYHDPHGQHRLRYWDGTQWTEHVSD